LSFFDNIQNQVLEEGITELTYVYSHLISLWVPDKCIQINPSISRWLNYYTGLVFETFIVWNEGVWSISSGWRYENLCSNFSSSSFPWVGGSIGISRLLAILKDTPSIEADKKTISDVLVVNTGNNLLPKNLDIVQNLRQQWVATELYLDENAKFAKQLKYANNKQIPYVIIHWEQEAEKWVVQIKVLATWEQKEIKVWDLIKNLFI
jgi:histidyl-tRNA synthetase